MKLVASGKSKAEFWSLKMAITLLAFFDVSCSSQSRPVAETDYPTKIIGSWQGSVGNVKETMSINGDGTFVCKLRSMGFISTMIFPRAPGTIRGTWNITGALMTLNVTGEQHERLENTTASSTIVSFREDKLVLKSDRGDTSTFQRIHSYRSE